MYLRFFKSSFASQYFIIGVIGIALWTGAFLHPPVMPPPDGPTPLYTLLWELLHETPLMATILGFILVLVETHWLTQILTRHELVMKNSSLSALVFLVLMSCYPEQLILNPVNIVILLLIFMLNNLLLSYNKPEHLDHVYAAGFFTAVAAMIYLPFILWFAFVIISFFIFRSGRWREWMSSLIGLCTPFIFLFSFYFWNDEFSQKLFEYRDFYRQLLVYPNPFKPDFIVISSFTLLFAMFGLIKLWGGPTEKTVEIRAKTNIFIWIIFFSILSFAYSRSLTVYQPALFAPAFALVITSSLAGLKKTRLMELILLAYFLIILFNNLVVHELLYH